MNQLVTTTQDLSSITEKPNVHLFFLYHYVHGMQSILRLLPVLERHIVIHRLNNSLSYIAVITLLDTYNTTTGKLVTPEVISCLGAITIPINPNPQTIMSAIEHAGTVLFSKSVPFFIFAKKNVRHC